MQGSTGLKCSFNNTHKTVSQAGSKFTHHSSQNITQRVVRSMSSAEESYEASHQPKSHMKQVIIRRVAQSKSSVISRSVARSNSSAKESYEASHQPKSRTKQGWQYGLSFCSLERALVELALTEGADEVFRVELLVHGGDAAAGDGGVAWGTKRTALGVEVGLAVRHSLVVKETRRAKCWTTFLQAPAQQCNSHLSGKL